jgi:hypothetical protein
VIVWLGGFLFELFGARLALLIMPRPRPA